MQSSSWCCRSYHDIIVQSRPFRKGTVMSFMVLLFTPDLLEAASTGGSMEHKPANLNRILPVIFPAKTQATFIRPMQTGLRAICLPSLDVGPGFFFSGSKYATSICSLLLFRIESMTDSRRFGSMTAFVVWKRPSICRDRFARAL